MQKLQIFKKFFQNFLKKSCEKLGNLLSQQNLKARLEQIFAAKSSENGHFSVGDRGKFGHFRGENYFYLAAASSFLFGVKNSHCAAYVGNHRFPGKSVC